MGRASQEPVQYSYDKFARMKAFYEKYGKDWKKKITVQNSSKVIAHFISFALKDDRGNVKDPLLEEKIKRINQFALDMANYPGHAYSVHCKDCGAGLHKEDPMLITLAEYEGLPCITPKECKTTR